MILLTMTCTFSNLSLEFGFVRSVGCFCKCLKKTKKNLAIKEMVLL